MRATIAAALLLAAGTRAETVQVHAGHLIDPAAETVTDDRLITIVDGRIWAVAPWPATPPPGRIVDWSRRWVLPGLIDMHTHVADGYGETSDPAEPLKHGAAEQAKVAAAVARTMLRAGFTTVRDVGVYRAFADVKLRDAIAAGRVEGPRMIVAGAYITTLGGGGAVTGAPPGTTIRPNFAGAMFAAPLRRGRACAS